MEAVGLASVGGAPVAGRERVAATCRAPELACSQSQQMRDLGGPGTAPEPSSAPTADALHVGVVGAPVPGLRRVGATCRTPELVPRKSQGVAHSWGRGCWRFHRDPHHHTGTQHHNDAEAGAGARLGLKSLAQPPSRTPVPPCRGLKPGLSRPVAGFALR